MNNKLKEVKTPKFKGSLIFRFSIICLVVYIISSIITTQLKITDKNEELDSVNSEISIQQLANDDLQELIDDDLLGDSQYAEEYAREELGYAENGERVFVNIGGN